MKKIEIPFYNNSLKVSYTDQGLTEVSFQNKKVTSFSEKDPMAKKINKSISTYLSGKSDKFDLPVDWENLPGTDFQKKVWRTMYKIPYGKVKTYGQIAKTVGSPQASRAVGSACGKNHLLLVIPCHRVVGVSGLGGFSGGGLPVKRKLHDLEGIHLN